MFLLNLVMSKKLRMARFTSTLLQSCDLKEIPQTQKEDFLQQKYLARSMPLFIPNLSFKACVDLEALTYTMIFR